jgi:hypothetical protein
LHADWHDAEQSAQLAPAGTVAATGAMITRYCMVELVVVWPLSVLSIW